MFTLKKFQMLFEQVIASNVTRNQEFKHTTNLNHTKSCGTMRNHAKPHETMQNHMNLCKTQNNYWEHIETF